MLRALSIVLVLILIDGLGRAHAQTTLDHMKASGHGTAATEAALEPFEFVKDGRIVGYGPDILAEVGKDAGVAIEQKDVPFQGILAGLDARQYDFVATTIGINPERASRYGFTRPIGTIATVIVTRADDSTIHTVSDLSGKVVGTQLASSPEKTLREAGEQLAKTGAGGFKDLRLYPSFPDTFFALGNRQVDAVAVASISAALLLKQRPGVFRVAGEIGDPVVVAWITRAEDRDLRGAINTTLARLIDSGALAKLQEKWFGFGMAVPATGYLPPGAID